MTKYRQLTEREFDKIKKLEHMDVLYVSGKFNRAPSTIYYIFKSKDFQEYKVLTATSRRHRYTQPEDTPSTPALSPELIEKMIAVLDNVLKVVEDLQEQMKLVPKRRKW